MLYVVHLPVPKQIESRFAEVRRRVSPQLVRKPKLEDHCTFAVGHFEESNESALAKTLSFIKYEPLQMSLQGEVEIFHPDILVALVKPTKKLQKMHEEVLERIAPLHSMRLTPPIPEEYKNDPERVGLYELYGSPFVKQFYRPHVSIGVVSSLPADKKLDILTDASWTAKSFRLSKRTDNGYKTVRDFKK